MDWPTFFPNAVLGMWRTLRATEGRIRTRLATKKTYEQYKIVANVDRCKKDKDYPIQGAVYNVAIRIF